MADDPGAPNASMLLRSTAIFRELSNDQLAEIWSRAKVHNLLRGDVLVRQKARRRTRVYVVVSGRFEVWIEGKNSPVTEIGVGEPIGEIGFFSGAPRTATIIAARDSVVIELDRASFDNVARQVPELYQPLLRALARRLAESSTRLAIEPRAAVARTIAVIAGGSQPIPQAFHDRLDGAGRTRRKGRVLEKRRSERPFRRAQALDDPERIQLAQCHRARLRADRLSRRRTR